MLCFSGRCIRMSSWASLRRLAGIHDALPHLTETDRCVADPFHARTEALRRIRPVHRIIVHMPEDIRIGHVPVDVQRLMGKHPEVFVNDRIAADMSKSAGKII